MKHHLHHSWSLAKTVNSLKTLGLLLLAVSLVSCSREDTKSDTVVIRGSNTIGEELAPRLIAEFKKENPSAAFDTEFKGTSYGLGALMVGRCDIAAASRDLSTNEMELARDREIQFNDYIIGSYSAAVVVNASNPLKDLTQDQVAKIFTGAIKNWKEIGGPDAAIHIYIRDPISGTYLGFQELAMDRKPYADGLKTFTNYTGIVQAVAKDPSGIGYAGIDFAKNSGVKAVSIGGIAPTAATVNEKKYPYARSLRLHTNQNNESAAAKKFIEFVQSPRGQAILNEMGFAPHP